MNKKTKKHGRLEAGAPPLLGSKCQKLGQKWYFIGEKFEKKKIKMNLQVIQQFIIFHKKVLTILPPCSR